MTINRKHIPSADSARRWKHLKTVADQLPPLLDVNVDIPIGANCNAAHTPLEIVSTTHEEPHARRTVLGWTVMGTHANSDTKE